jgi:outer membrane receptor protein involved in Fe transport
MKKPVPMVKPLAVAISLALIQISTANAQTAPAAPAAAAADANATDALKLDAIVITGSSTARSKFKQSVSISTLDADDVQKLNAASAVDILRSIPGIRAEASGGEGNANISVRGLPSSDGGGRYVQLQEDGLPVLLFGDIAFGTADEFFRTTYSLDTIDVIRGGSAGTSSTNSPGAIINYRTKTGKDGGAAFGLTTGINGFKGQRGDFTYSGNLGTGTYFNIGGFYRSGEGARPTNITAEKGGQINLSATHEFAGGYFRVNLKYLDDSTPTYLPVPVDVKFANGVTTINQYPGVDPRRAFFISSNFPRNTTVNQNGGTETNNPADGLSVRNQSLGFEGQYTFAGDLTVSNKFRVSAIEGRFVGLFPAGRPDAATYKGTTPVFTGVLFDTALNDLGNVFNDAKVSKVVKLSDSSKLTVTGGLFLGKQNVAMTWDWNNYNVELTGRNARLFDNAGAVTTNFVGDAFTTFGGCCFRGLDVSVKATAPYAAVAFDAGPLTIDASVRNETQKISGITFQADAETGVWNRAPRVVVPNPTPTNPGNPNGQVTVNAKSSGTSYSFGGNFTLSNSAAIFARYSQAVSWKAVDRAVLFSPEIATGIDAYPINKIKQAELGTKLRFGPMSAFLTFFSAKTKEGEGFEATTQKVLGDSYKSSGLEAELGYRSGPIRWTGGATFTNAKLTSGDNNGKVPKRQAKVVYQSALSYGMDKWEAGLSLAGTTKSFAGNENQAELPAYMTLNAFGNFEVYKNVSINLGVSNLLNKIGYTEDWRSINGRTAKLGIKYSY